MSIYGYFVCLDCKVALFLGKAVFHSTTLEAVKTFWPGKDDEIRTKALFKMLADHARHSLKVVIEGDDDFEMLDEFAYIGEPIEGNIDISKYIESD